MSFPPDEEGAVGAQRYRDVVLLAQGWLDFFPLPGSHTRTGSGPAPRRKQPCEECQGGLTRDGRPCSACDGGYVLNGHGGLDKKPGRGWVWVDDYTGEPVRTVETDAAPRVRSAVCDSCGGDGAHGNGRRCLWCRGTGRVLVRVLAEPEQKEILDPLWDALKRHRKRRDELAVYRDFAEALARLKEADRYAAQVFAWTFILGAQQPGTLPDTGRMALLRAVVFLAGAMPAGRIRVPREIRVRAEACELQLRQVRGNEAPRPLLARRNALIRRRRAEGASVEGLMVEFKLSRRMVMYVLAEGERKAA